MKPNKRSKCLAYIAKNQSEWPNAHSETKAIPGEYGYEWIRGYHTAKWILTNKQSGDIITEQDAESQNYNFTATYAVGICGSVALMLIDITSNEQGDELTRWVEDGAKRVRHGWVGVIDKIKQRFVGGGLTCVATGVVHVDRDECGWIVDVRVKGLEIEEVDDNWQWYDESLKNAGID